MISVKVNAPGLKAVPCKRVSVVTLVRVGKIIHEHDIFLLREVNGTGEQNA